MARVTVEDCKKIIPNHFELVVLASRRGRDIASGSPILVERSNDKNAVVALREIASKKLNIDLLRENILNDFCKNKSHVDNFEDTKLENYIDIEATEDANFERSFEDDFSGEDMFSDDITTIETEDDDLSFGDDNPDIED